MSFDLKAQIDNIRAKKESNFYNNLLAYGMNAAGSFSTEGGKLNYSSGNMPDKTAMWNEFVTVKGGNITQQDIANFEASWKQANMVKSQSAISELGKLQNMGYDSEKIAKVIKEDDNLYNNLLDMVSELETQGLAGDENAMFAAENLKGYFPEDDKGFFAENPFWSTTLTSLGLLGAANRKPIINKAKKIIKKRKPGKIKGVGPVAAYTAYEAAPSIGKWAFGEGGEEIGETAGKIGLLGLAGKQLMKKGSIPTRLAGAAMYSAPVIYDYFFPDEE